METYANGMLSAWPVRPDALTESPSSRSWRRCLCDINRKDLLLKRFDNVSAPVSNFHAERNRLQGNRNKRGDPRNATLPGTLNVFSSDS